jgi:uncharacterized protein
MLLTAELLLNYERCPRRAFLDIYGDPSQKAPPSDFLLKLAQDSLSHKQTILTDQTWHRPHYQQGDWVAGASATLDLMQQGVEQIHQGILLVRDAQGMTLMSSPDLLTKQPGQSYFGDWIYTPTDIRLGKRPKLGYQIVAAFHVKLLATVQGAWPETAGIFLRDRGLYAVDLWQFVPQMQVTLEELSRVLQQQQEPEVFIARNRCNLCSWFNHCYAIAQSQHHLSLLPGVTASRYPLLQQLDLTSVEALATADPSQLQPLLGHEVAIKLVQQAQAVVENQAILVRKNCTSAQPVYRTDVSTTQITPFFSNNSLAVPIELYFDIEAEPGLNLAYLHGVLVVNHQAKTQIFYPFLAESPENENLIWQQFLDLVQAYPTAPIFHFCSYEIHTVERLAKLYQTPRRLVKPLLDRFVDLHQWLTQTVTLPVENYTLKVIARWLDFQWRDRDASGAQSIYWYSQWLKTGDRTFLEAILRYNEDDCRATYHIKDWLANFIQG